MIKSFLGTYAPGKDLYKASDDIINEYNNILPEEIITLWYSYGFGNYGKGIVKIIYPTLYRNNLDYLLKEKDKNNIPFMITGFGDIYYINKDKEIYLYKIHYKKNEYCAKNLEEFFKDYIVHSKVLNNELRYNLFNQAVKSLGELDNDDIFNFIPSLRFGGKEQEGYIQKTDAVTAQSLLSGD